jgi:multiple sugar transport system ATP-binding protein
MNAGQVEQIGAPLELYDRPANLFVASFIGSPSMNFFNGVLRPKGRDIFLAEENIELPIPQGRFFETDMPAVYGIRPEDIRIASAGVPLTAQVIEPTGAEVHISGKVGDIPFVAVSRDRILPEPGETIHFLPEVERVSLFDMETGMRMEPSFKNLEPAGSNPRG